MDRNELKEILAEFNCLRAYLDIVKGYLERNEYCNEIGFSSIVLNDVYKRFVKNCTRLDLFELNLK